MTERLICATSDNIPDWVTVRARMLGIRFVCLRPGPNPDHTSDSLQAPSALSRDDVTEQLDRLQPVGYLMNGPPDYGPYLDAALATISSNLKLVTYFGQSLEPAEYDAFLDMNALSKHGITITTTPGATDSVAEGTIALLLASNLNLVSLNSSRKEGRDHAPGSRAGVYDATLGIVGMGQIGTRVAEVARSLGMQVRYTSRTRKAPVEKDLDATFSDLPALFHACDYVTIHTPGSVTEGLINQDVLAHARGITLINATSAPRIVDPVALLDSLDSGRVGRVAIEGAYAEPFDSQLREFGDDRVLLLPGYTSWDTERSRNEGWKRYLETLEAFVTGTSLPYQLTDRT